MNDNFYNSRKLRPVNISSDVNKNGNISSNFSHNQINNRQTINHNPSGNHLTQNIIPQLVNLISPQIPVSQSANQTLINMGFNAASFLPNQLYSIPNTFGALNTIASQSYGTNNASYINNMRINHSQPQAIMNFKENKVSHIASDINSRKLKSDGIVKNNQNPIKTSNYPVRLLINSELVGPLIGRKGEKIKEITANTGAKIDIKRESVPYSQFGLNNYMFSGCNRKGSGLSDNDQIVAANNANRGESQIVFIVSEPDKCSAAISEIMQLCTQEAKEQGREEPNMGLLAEDRFCARLIGKEGRFLNWVRCKSGSQVHVSNVPTITTLSEQPHIISLDRIISCRGGGLASLLEAEKFISDKIRQCVAEDNAQKPCPRLAKDDSFLPPRAGDMSIFGRMYPPEDFLAQRRPHNSVIGSGIVHKANPNWPDNLKLDENLYVRIPQVCAGSIIGSEGKSVRRIMAETGTYIQISKSNLGSIESVPAVHTYRKQPVPESSLKDELNERLITIKGTAPSQCSALTHIFSRVRICYSQTNEDLQQQQVRLWVLLRVPKLMLGRLIGKEGKVIRQLQLSSRTFLSFPRLKHIDNSIDSECCKAAPPEDSIANSTITNTNAIITNTMTINSTNNTSATKIIDPPDSASGDQKKQRTVASHSNETLHNPDCALFGDADLHPVEIFGTYEAVEAAIYMIRRLVYSSIFAQFGPALIPGPTPQLSMPPPPPFQQLPPPPPHTLLMPPPPLLLPAAAAQRRNSDCPGGPFFNNISSLHPAFMQQTVRAPHSHSARNYKKMLPCNQRSKIEHRSQSDCKAKSDIGEYTDPAVNSNTIINMGTGGGGSGSGGGGGGGGSGGSVGSGGNMKKLDATDHLVYKDEENDINGNSLAATEPDCSALSPKCILLHKRQHQESPAIFSQEGPFAQAPPAGHSREDLAQMFNPTSPCSYYTDCGSSTPNFLNISAATEDDLSFITAAQDSFSSINNSFPDPNPPQHTQSQSPSLLQSNSTGVGGPPLQQQQQQPPPPPQQQQQQQQSQQQSFSHWSSPPNPPF